MASPLRDFLYAARGLRKTPTFTLTAVLTLALGIGVSTAIFSVANAVLLRPLPYADAERLVLVWGDMRNRNVNDFPFPPGDFQDLKTETNVFEDLAAVAPGRQPLAEDAVPQPPPPQGAQGAPGGPNAAPAAPPLPTSVLLSHAFWQRRYGGDPAVVGRTLDLGGNRALVVGVLAPGFEILFPPGTNV